jgi:hypothetical protein
MVEIENSLVHVSAVQDPHRPAKPPLTFAVFLGQVIGIAVCVFIAYYLLKYFILHFL